MKKSILLTFACFLGCFVPVSLAQTQVAPFLTPNQQFLDSAGNPLAGGKVCTFQAGTSTPQASYSEATGTTPNANPIILDSAGRATIFLTTASYKIIVAASTANSVCSPAITTADNVTWNNLAQSLTSLTVSGPLSMQTSTAATSGANQSSPPEKLCGNYWNGSVSGPDCWTWTDVLGTGSNPTSTLTPSHSGSSGFSSLDLSNFASKIAPYNIKGIFVVDGIKYTTIQAAITDACAATPTGGTVLIPPGTYAQNSAFTLCSNLNLIGAGRCQADATNCPTLITTTMTSGDLFPVTNMTDIHISDFGVKSTSATPANAFIHLNYGQRIVAERLYLYGGGTGFNKGISLETSSTSTASTIWNTFRDIHITGLATNGIACEMNSNDAINKVINNNYWINVSCVAGTGANAVGFKVTNTNLQQNINENFVASGELATSRGGSGGTGILMTSTATRGIVFYGANVENNATGLNKATGNTATFIGGNFSANDTNVTDAQPSFTGLINTNVGGTLQNFGITPAGGVYADGIGLGAAAPVTGKMNSATGGCWAIGGTCVETFNTGSVVAAQPFQTPSIAINGGTALTGQTGTGTSVVTNTAPTIGGTSQFNRIKANQGTALVTGDVGSLTGWGNTASVSSVSGTDQAALVTLSCSGTGQTANPSGVVTFHDGSWTNAPVIAISRFDNNSPGGSPVISTASATAFTFVFPFTCTAGNSYSFSFMAMGK